jgi:hypothetical protein
MNHFKKHLAFTICIIISTNTLFGQLKESVINKETNNYEIKYSNAKQDLKELLAIQGLLSENRMNELSEFLDKNHYQPTGSEKGITFMKMDFLNPRKVHEVFPFITIQSGKQHKDYVDNSLSITFLKMAESDDGLKRILHSYSDAVKIQEFVNQLIDKHMYGKQFEYSNITLHEIELVKKVLIKRLVNIYHLRIEYPE